MSMMPNWMHDGPDEWALLDGDRWVGSAWLTPEGWVWKLRTVPEWHAAPCAEAARAACAAAVLHNRKEARI